MIATILNHLLPLWFIPSQVFHLPPPGVYMAVKDKEEEPTSEEVKLAVGPDGKVDLAQTVVKPRPQLISDPEDGDEEEDTEVRNLRKARAQVRTVCANLDDVTTRFKRKSGEIKAVMAHSKDKELEMPLGGAAPFRLTTVPTRGGFVAPPTAAPEPSFFVTLYQREQDRIRNIAAYWRAYNGLQDPKDVNPDDPQVNPNWIRKFIDIGVYFLVGGGFTNKVAKPLYHISRPIVEEAWKVNHRDRFTNAAAQTGAVAGDWFALIARDNPTELERQIRPYTKGRTRLKLFGSEQVFCTWDPLDRETLISVRIETWFYSTTDSLTDQAPTASQRHTLTITRTQIMSQVQGQQPKFTPNVLGEIPLVHCKNLELAGEYYGLSDVTDLLPLVKDLAEKVTDVSNSINANGVPTLAVFGAKAKALDKEPTTFWSGLPEKARIEVIRLGMDDVGGAMTYIKDREKVLHVLAGVPEGLAGGQVAISNTSGIAVQMFYQPVNMKTSAKRAQMEPAMERINYFFLRYAAVYGDYNPPYDLCSCGGRIVEVETGKEISTWDPISSTYVTTPERKKKCYRVDPQTLEFQTPKEVVVKALLNYGVASHVREVPYAEVQTKAAEGKKSFWAMATQETAEDGAAVPKLPPDAFPKEPETVMVVRQYVSPEDGRVLQETRERMTLVPTDCCSPEYLDPFATEVTFNGVIPKDDVVEMDKLVKAIAVGVVDAEFVQDQFPYIAEQKYAINERLRRDKLSAEQKEAEALQAEKEQAASEEISDKSVAGKSKAQEK